MIAVKPMTINSANLLSSNVPENDYPAYDSQASYVTDDIVLYQYHNYKALASVSGVAPDTDSTKWQDLGFINRYKMFDSIVGSITTNPNSIEFSFVASGIVDAIGLLEVQAESIAITVTDPYEGVVYSVTKQMADTGVFDWYGFFYDDYYIKRSLVLLDLPPYAGATIEVVMTGINAVECGMFIAGRQQFIGNTQYGITTGITDYSRKTTDGFGQTTVIERSYANRSSASLELPTPQVARIQALLTSWRATPMLYVGGKDLESTHVFGFYKDFKIPISNSIFSNCNIEIEGLI